ncbi:MAG: hypothetical protein IT423_04670, partial [Pirellulaceae bacterium]|nr:hypothetical protein [Pirellulaceae bacterium]
SLGADRAVNIYNPDDANKLTLRTTSPTAGISLELSTVQITAISDLPSQLTQDLTFDLDIDGAPISVTITAASTRQNSQPADMIGSINRALNNASFAGAGLDQKLRAVLIGNRVRLVNIDSATVDLSIDGAELLGFLDSQSKDINTARTELGLGENQTESDGSGGSQVGFRDGMLATPKFRVNTIQDLVHVLNGLIQQQFNGLPFTATLNYEATPVRTVTFNVAMGTTFTKSVELNFDQGLDVGFAQLSVAGSVDATITANAGVEFTVGLDLDAIGSGQVVSATTSLNTLDKGRGVQVKVGRLGAPVNSSGRGTTASSLTLALAVSRYGNLSDNVSVTIPAAQVADNTSLTDLARDLSDALRAVNIPGLASVGGIAPLEVQAFDGRLLIVANAKAINGFTIGAGTSGFLGFTTGQTSNQPDLSILLRNGTTFTVDLDFSQTLGDVKSRIEAAAGGPSVLEVTFVGDAIQLRDKTTQVAANKFKVTAAGDENGISPIGSILGIITEVTPVSDDPSTPADETNNGDILRGGSLLSAPITDQFYIKTGNSKAFANVSIEADDISLIASLGILDLGIVDGTLNFSINASLTLTDVNNPDTPGDESLDGKLRLSDFSTAGFGEILTPSFTYGGSTVLPIDGSLLTFLPPQFLPGGSSPLAIQVNLTNQVNSLKPNLQFQVDNFQAALSSFKDFSVADLVGVIQRVVELLKSSDLSGLNTVVPVVNKTPNEILDVVGSLADAAAELLGGPDAELIDAKILELEELLTRLGGTPEQIETVREQIAKIKSAANPNHVFRLSLTQAPPVAPEADIPVDAAASEVFDELTRLFGPNVIDSVTGERGGPYTVTFNAALGDVASLKGTSTTGVAVQTRTLTQGAANTTSEVQQLTFVTTGPLIAATTLLRNTLLGIPASVVGRNDMNVTLSELSGAIASRGSLGKIIGDAIKDRLGLPANAFALEIEFMDADANVAGFQAAAVIRMDIDKSITRKVDFDLDLPDLGPVTVRTGGTVDFTVTADLNLDFGFRFSTFTPYLLKSTSIVLSTSINSAVSVTAGIGGIEGNLTGQMRLRGSTVTPIANGVTQFQLPAVALDNLVVVTRNGVVLKRGNLLTDVGVDYIVETTVSPARLRFRTATTAGTQVEYATATSPENASISILVDPDLVPADANTIGGISFAQVFSSTIPLADKFNLTLNGMALASLDASLLGQPPIEDAVTVVVGLNNPTAVSIRFDGVKDFINSLTDLRGMNLQQLVSGARALVSVIETSVKDDLLQKMPLVGDNVNLNDTFVGKLKRMIDELESLLNRVTGSVDALKFQIQSSIFNSLGPGGANVLRLNPLLHDDPNVINSAEQADARDVNIVISNPVTTAPADLEFAINLTIGGNDRLEVDFDLGVDAMAFDLTTSGGVQIDWSYNFNFGFGINLQRGFFFQLNPNVTYSGGLPSAGTPEIGLAVDLRLKPGTTLAGKLFFLDVSATSNAIEDFNRDGIINDGTSGPGRGPRLNEAVDQFDYNRDGDTSDLLTEVDIDGNGRLSKGTGLSGNIFIDIANPDNDPRHRLTFSEIRQTPKKTLFNAGISTEAYADLRMNAEIGAGLPKVTADLTLDWAIGLTTRDGLIGGGLPDIAIRDAKLDMGSFITTVIRPVFDGYKTYVGPLRPLIDFLASPVPGLNDLSELLDGPELTFLTLGIVGASRTEQSIAIARQAQKVVGLLQEAFKFIDSLDEATQDGSNIIINFGTFYVTGKPLPVTNVATTGTTLERILPSNPRAGTPVSVFRNGVELPRTAYKLVRFKDGTISRSKIVFTAAQTGTITASYTTTEGGSTDLTNKNTAVKVRTNSLDTTIPTNPNGAPTSNILDQSTNTTNPGLGRSKSMLSRLTGQGDARGKGGLGIKIPLLSDPSNIFKLFTGEKADIIQWDIPRLDLNVPFSMRFGPIPIPPVPLFATFNAKLQAFADFSIGFDTRGIAKTGNFIDGFYFGDLANVTSGADIDEFGLSLEASVGAAIDLTVAKAGIEGGVRANIGMNWNDLDGDGKLYLDELVDLFSLMPTPSTGADFPGICVFDASGSINAFVRAYYEVALLGGDSITIADINLFEFNHSCAAPGLGEVTAGRSDFDNGTLLLYAGDYAEGRSTLYGTDPNEEFTVTQTVDAGQPAINVTFNYLNRDGQPDTQTRIFKGVQRIFFSGGNGNDKITIDPSVTVPVRLFGGEGNDILVGGSGADVLVGGDGNDVLTGGLGNDRYVFADNWGVDSITESALGPDTLDTFDFSSVTANLAISNALTATSGANAVNSDQPGQPVSGIERVIGGAGNDTLTVSTVIGAGSTNVWTLTGVDKGNINAAFLFEKVENLVGGNQDDRFVFDGQDRISGSILAGDGTDTLDYSAYTSLQPVHVQRQTRVASGVPRFESIEAVIGGASSADELTGRSVTATWNITNPNAGSILDTGTTIPFTFTGFENLTGGDSNDNFVVSASGRLSGKLLGTDTPGRNDADRLDLSSFAIPLTVQVHSTNAGLVNGTVPLFDFESIESAISGSGDDTFIMAPFSGLTGTTSGGSGTRDVLSFIDWSVPITVNLSTSANHIGTVSGIEDIVGGTASDTLTGNDLDNRIFGMDGDDTIVGRNGNDLLVGDSAQITSAGGLVTSVRILTTFAGNDRLTGGSGNNLVFGGLGDDTIVVGNGNNFVAGDVVLLSSSGSNTSIQSLIGPNEGNDTITLGTGNDVAIAGLGNDVVTDTGGRNVIVGDRGAVELVNNVLTGARTIISSLSGLDRLTTGAGNDTVLAGGNFDEVLAGGGNNFVLGDDGAVAFINGVATSATLFEAATDGNDVITTLDGRDVIYTGDGDNTVLAGSGDDDVFGGAGIDLLSGQAGNDFLVGMLGDDVLDGGADNDVMFGGLPVGRREDYELNTSDFVLPPDFVTVEALYPSGYVPAVRVTPAIFGGLSIDGVTQDGRDRLLGGTGIDVLLGGSQEDELTGGDGPDYLDGGAGNEIILDGGIGDDVVRGGAGDDIVNGDSGIDNIYGDDGDDILKAGPGSAGDVQAGQRLFGGQGRDSLYAYAPTITAANFIAQTLLIGDQLFGGDDGDFLYGNIRREVFDAGDGNDYVAGDITVGPDNSTHAQANVILPAGVTNVVTRADTHGGADRIFGGGGEDQLYGGGGDDIIWGGSGTDFIDGQRGLDLQYGGSGIDLFQLRTDELLNDTIDGHFGNFTVGDIADDNATDVLMISGTTSADTILIGQRGVQASVLYKVGTAATQEIPVTMLNASGEFLIEQFRIAGLASSDTLGFYSLQAIDAGIISPSTIPAGFLPVNTSSLTRRSRDFVGVIDGNSGNDTLLGSDGRDQMDGGLGSDSLYGFSGDDRLWGDQGNGSITDADQLFAGGGNDDLIGGLGTNNLYACSFDPTTCGQFGLFTNSKGRLFTNDGDLNDNGILDLDDGLLTGPRRIAHTLQNTGLNRMLGGERADNLFGGTVVDFMYGNGGQDTMFRANGTTFESLDEGLAGDDWKRYARESDQVWYVGGTNAADEIRVDFVTEPGLLTDHHLITRLTNNNGNFSFAAQVRLDFNATDSQGNTVWDADTLKFRVDQLLSDESVASRAQELSRIGSATVERVNAELLARIIPPEGDFQVILIDALEGNDQITVGPTVQKSVWIDAGAGDDVVEIRTGNSILVDKTERTINRNNGVQGRNDLPDQAFTLTSVVNGVLQAADGTPASTGGLEFNGLSMDSPNDVDWYRFTLASTPAASARIDLASGSSIDALAMEIFVEGSDTSNVANRLKLGTTTGNAGAIALSGLNANQVYLLKVTTPRIVPTTYGLRLNLLGTTSTTTLATIPKLDLAVRNDMTRRDVILGNTGDDILRGGAGEDWIFGNAGNDVLIGGQDRGASDLMFGGSGDDTFQLITDALPLLGSEPNTDFDPTTKTVLTTLSDQLFGGAGNDRVLYLGGDTDRRGFDVPDYVAVQYDSQLHRYELTDLVWDIGTQSFRTTTDANGLTVYQQQHVYYQTHDVENSVVSLRAGDDVFRADAGFRFLPLGIAADTSARAHYTFDGNNALDISGKNNHGTLQASALTVADNFVFNRALSLNGTSDFVSVNSPSVPIGNAPYTVAAWIKPDTMHNGGIIGWGNYGATNQVTALRLSSTGLGHGWGNNDLVSIQNLAGTWNHVAATFDGTTRRIFVNGVQVASDVPAAGVHAVPNSNNFAIGRTAATEFFDGLIDDVRVFSVARTPATIAAIFNTGRLGLTGSSQFPAYGYELGDFEQQATIAALRVDGGTGNDALFGGPLADILDGAEGNDWLVGGPGDDELNGGGGADTLFGNLPADGSTSLFAPASFGTPAGFPTSALPEVFLPELAAPFTDVVDTPRTGFDVSLPTPVVYYSFDNATNLGQDLSGNNNNATLTPGIVSAASGKRGAAAQFTGVNDVLLLSSQGIDLGPSWTASAWFRGLIDTSAANTLFKTFGVEEFIHIPSGTNNVGVINQNGVPLNSGLELIPSLLGNSWNQITIVGFSFGLEIYLNGVLVATSVYNGSKIRSIGNL